MSDPTHHNDPSGKRRQLFQQRRSQLITAIFSSNSAYNGDTIYALLEELQQLADTSLSTDLARCEALVQQWKDTWYPDLS